MTKLITPAQLKLHDSISDLWIAINGKVYDVTDFVSDVNQF